MIHHICHTYYGLPDTTGNGGAAPVNAEVPSSLLQRIVAPLLHHTCPAVRRNKQRFVPSDRTTNRRLLVRSSRAEILRDLIRVDSGGAFGLIRYPGAGEKLVGYGKGRYD